ncbi:formate hydrogenlyase maturation protein HycH [Salmonella enterica]|uniref:Formate hydrogenlyase maturation protein HycH n=1 Tax=Salmonella enterica TaxID=28901 RepID=A0A5U2F8U9_SALER|nr:formate hydrogenlyase maturation protein HycH [Salmonella enterica]HAK1938867.1 HycH family protein [Salmonella enterica]
MVEENGEIVFWMLRQKFISSEDTIPETSCQVMYYSLAIGHHVGVIDCLKVALRCPIADYRNWAAQMEDEQARQKMLGVLTFDEIVIDASHTNMLTRACTPLAENDKEPCKSLSIKFVQLLDDIVIEPAIYLMARKVA